MKIHTYLTERGFKPLTQVLDNECPEKLKTYFRSRGMHFQLVPPHLHRNNRAERAIATFKDHLISGIATTDPSFPIHLWDRLIPQAVLTLNLLRPSRYNPRLSAWAALNGAFDFNATPLAPPGTRVFLYDPPANRRTWDPHATEGWYLGPALDHYRCYRCYVPKTRAERVVRTVKFMPTTFNMPQLSSKDAAIDAALQLTKALENPHPASVLIPPSLEQAEALRKLASIFNCSVNLENNEEPRVRRNHNKNDDETIENPLKKMALSDNKILGAPRRGASRGGVRLPPWLLTHLTKQKQTRFTQTRTFSNSRPMLRPFHPTATMREKRG